MKKEAKTWLAGGMTGLLVWCVMACGYMMFSAEPYLPFGVMWNVFAFVPFYLAIRTHRWHESLYEPSRKDTP
jgi:hypothetical protein